MKSSFLFLVIITCFASTQAFAQMRVGVKPSDIQKKNKAKSAPVKKVTTLVPTTGKPEEIAVPKTAFDKFYDRLTIGHFTMLTTPNFETWNTRGAALSPQYSGKTNTDTYPMNLWNQTNFGYDFGAKMRFNVIPRYTVFLGKAKDQDPGERGMILLEDALVGFSGVVFTSANKKFNWWMRPGVRLPTSHATRHTVDATFGRLNYNLEIVNSFTYDFNDKWQLGLTFQDRWWIYNQRYNNSRNRLYLAPNFTYTLNETTKITGYYENMLENNRRWESINGKNPTYRNVWQNVFLGVAKDVTPKLNVYPFLASYVNTTPFSMKAFWIGAWISYQIK